MMLDTKTRKDVITRDKYSVKDSCRGALGCR